MDAVRKPIIHRADLDFVTNEDIFCVELPENNALSVKITHAQGDLPQYAYLGVHRHPLTLKVDVLVQ